MVRHLRSKSTPPPSSESFARRCQIGGAGTCLHSPFRCARRRAGAPRGRELLRRRPLTALPSRRFRAEHRAGGCHHSALRRLSRRGLGPDGGASPQDRGAHAPRPLLGRLAALGPVYPAGLRSMTPFAPAASPLARTARARRGLSAGCPASGTSGSFKRRLALEVAL